MICLKELYYKSERFSCDHKIFLSIINGTNILTSQAKRFSVITSQCTFVDTSCKGEKVKYLIGVLIDPVYQLNLISSFTKQMIYCRTVQFHEIFSSIHTTILMIKYFMKSHNSGLILPPKAASIWSELYHIVFKGMLLTCTILTFWD